MAMKTNFGTSGPCLSISTLSREDGIWRKGTTKESVFESGAWTNISCNRRSTNFEFHLITIGRDLVQLPVFVTAALKRKYKKLAFILSRVCPSLPPVYNGIRLCMPPLLHHPPFILRKQVAFVLILLKVPVTH